MAKNLTLSIDEDLLDRARVLAAMRRTSVNALVRDFLSAEVKRETDMGAKAEAWNSLFRRSDAQVSRRSSRRETLKTQSAHFDRAALYEEAMRERGLL